MTSTTFAPTLQDAFRGVMGNVATPVSIVTSIDGDTPHGTTVSAFASLSMDPAMVLVSLDRRSELLGIVGATRRFGLNILSAQQIDVASRFASKGTDRFATVTWTLDSGLPRLDGSSGWVACELDALVDGGDHEIALGRVIAAEHADLAPLTYHRRRFGTHTDALVD